MPPDPSRCRPDVPSIIPAMSPTPSQCHPRCPLTAPDAPSRCPAGVTPASHAPALSPGPRCPRRCVTGCGTAPRPGTSGAAASGGPGVPGGPAAAPAGPGDSAAHGDVTKVTPGCCGAAAGRESRRDPASTGPARVSGGDRGVWGGRGTPQDFGGSLGCRCPGGSAGRSSPDTESEGVTPGLGGSGELGVSRGFGVPMVQAARGGFRDPTARGVWGFWAPP